MPLGDGVLCVGGMLRLRIGLAGPDGVATIGPGLSTPGAWSPGQTIVLQAWHCCPQAGSALAAKDNAPAFPPGAT